MNIVNILNRIASVRPKYGSQEAKILLSSPIEAPRLMNAVRRNKRGETTRVVIKDKRVKEAFQRLEKS